MQQIVLGTRRSASEADQLRSMGAHGFTGTARSVTMFCRAQVFGFGARGRWFAIARHRHKDLEVNTDHSPRGHVETADQSCPATEGDELAALIDEQASLLPLIPFLRDRVVFLCTRERTVDAFPMSGLVSGRHDLQRGA